MDTITKIVRSCADIHPELQPETCARCRGFAPQTKVAGGNKVPRTNEFPCPNLEPLTGERLPLASCVKDPPDMVEVYGCKIHGKCTKTQVAKGNLATCKYCADRPRAEKTPIEWISFSTLAKDSVILASKIPNNVNAIVGVPRSGMIPASIVATLLHLPLWQLSSDGQLIRLGNGSRGSTILKTGRFAVIDDTVYSGRAMLKARSWMMNRMTLFAAVYVKPGTSAVDLFTRELPSPHLLEWNWSNNTPLIGNAGDPIYKKGIGADLDGIICHDENSGGKSLSPYMVSRFVPIPLIVTGRPESHRSNTENWLKDWGVKYGKLVMYPGDVMPNDPMKIAVHKAKAFKESGCGFFIESDPKQAMWIYQLTKLPVICPIEEKVYQS